MSRPITAVDLFCGLTYGSVCSGIEAASVAWHPLGWQPAWLAEIEPFPAAVLAHRFPEVPNYGDFTKINDDAPPIDLLVGGTPCQDFSVAGLRAGLGGDRGKLTIEFVSLAGRLRPRWLAWENVPGVLSADGGRAFGAFLGMLGKLGYGFAYRVLDAQHFGVPQRRRRVFVVGHLGDWRPAAAVLFELHSLQGHPPPGREAREEVAGCLGVGSGERGWAPDTDRMTFVPRVSRCVSTRGGNRLDSEMEQFVAGTINANGRAAGSATQQDAECGMLVAHTLSAEGADASEDGSGRGATLVIGGGSWPTSSAIHPGLTARHGDTTAVVPILEAGARAGRRARLRDGLGVGAAGDPMFTLQSAHQHAVASFDERNITSRENRSRVEFGDPSHALHEAAPSIIIGSGVRRLTPRECERLQGFPDDWTLVPYRGKPAADGPRYRAIGNSMAVPVMRWIGERIGMVERTARALAMEVLG